MRQIKHRARWEPHLEEVIGNIWENRFFLGGNAMTWPRSFMSVLSVFMIIGGFSAAGDTAFCEPPKAVHGDLRAL